MITALTLIGEMKYILLRKNGYSKSQAVKKLIEEQKKRTSEIRNCIVLLVGDKPFFDDDPVKFAHILRQPPDEKGYFHFDETADWKNRPFDIGSMYGIFDGIVHNNGETRKNFIYTQDPDYSVLVNLWDKACSNVQWTKS